MGRREQFTVGELTITQGIRSYPYGELATRMLQGYFRVPAAKVADRYFASAAMHNGAYAVANGGLPGDGLAHNVTCVQTAVDAEDTNGTLTVTGVDLEDKPISEVITPNAGATVEGAMAFKRVDSITGAGWVAGGGDDTIVIGFGDVIGLPHRLQGTQDILLAAFDTAVLNAPTVTVDAAVLAKNTVKVVGDAAKALRVIYRL